jgi:hypothetical protein
MLQRFRTMTVSAALALTGLLATAGTAAATPSAHGRAAVVVHTTKKHQVAGPATTRPGVAKLSNTGSRPIFLATPRHGASRAVFARDLNASSPAGFLTDFTVADMLPGKATTYVRLHRGTYYLADTSREKFTAASIATLHTTGRTINAATPATHAVTISSHNTVSGPATLPTDSALRFTNSSSTLQELMIAPVAKKVTDAQLETFMTKPDLTTLVTIISGEPAILAMLSPKAHAISSHHSKTGRYLIIMFGLTKNTTSQTTDVKAHLIIVT